MATGFDELVEQLLYDVALAGREGIGVPELEQAARSFYQSRHIPEQPTQPMPATEDDLLFSDAPPTSTTNEVDYNFLDAVWDWLCHHPDVLIDYNEDEADSARTEQHRTSNTAPSAHRHARQRIFTTEDRTWQVIAGHGVDHSRLAPLYFECLRVIAAHGPKGIVQPDLRRITDQDKRSVPHRTDVLAQQGYITKEPVVARGAGTSLLRLRRFAKDVKVDSAQERTTTLAEGMTLHYDECFDKMIKLLKVNGNIIAIADLLLGLGIYENRGKTRAFRYGYKRLAKQGCIRKLLARVDEVDDDTEAGGKEAWIRCVQLMREPTETDRVWFKKNAGPMKRRNRVSNQTEGGSDTSDSEEDVEAGQEDGALMNTGPAPEWTPDLPHANFLYRIIADAGVIGITSFSLDERIGGFWRRPLDELLARLSDPSRHKQPSHLKHLNIVREPSKEGKRTQFRYRTLENFGEAVKMGQTTWKVVQGSREDVAALRKSLSTEARVDQWGFPQLRAYKFAGTDGRASLLQCQGVAEAPTEKKDDRSAPSKATHKRKFDDLVQPNDPTAPVIPSRWLNVTFDPSGKQVDKSKTEIARHVATTAHQNRENSDQMAQMPEASVPTAETRAVDENTGPTPPATVNPNPSVKAKKVRLRHSPQNHTAGPLVTTSGLHINPSGSYPPHLIKAGRRKIVLVAVFKSWRLAGLPCFRQSGPAAVLDPALANVPSGALTPGNGSDETSVPKSTDTATTLPAEVAPVQNSTPALPVDVPTPYRSTDGPTPKRARLNADTPIKMVYSSLASLESSIKLPKGTKPGRPTDGELARRAQRRADIAQEMLATGAAKLASESAEAPQSPPAVETSLIAKLPIKVPEPLPTRRLLSSTTPSVPRTPVEPKSNETGALDVDDVVDASAQTPAEEVQQQLEVGGDSGGSTDLRHQGDTTPAPAVQEPPHLQSQETIQADWSRDVDANAQAIADGAQRDLEATDRSGVPICPRDDRLATPAPGVQEPMPEFDTEILHRRLEDCVLQIVRDAKGAHAADLNLSFAVADCWDQANGPTPDRNSVMRTVSRLVAQDRIQKYKFTFEDEEGKQAERAIVTESGIDLNSAVVQEVRKNIVRDHPYRNKWMSTRREKLKLADEKPNTPQSPGAGAPSTNGASNHDAQFPASELRSVRRKGRIAAEFPAVHGVTVKRTAKGIEAAQAEEKLFHRNFRHVPALGRNRFRGLSAGKGPQGLNGVLNEEQAERGDPEEVGEGNEDIEERDEGGNEIGDIDDDDNYSSGDDTAPVAEKQAAGMTSFQLERYAHDPSAVPKRFATPRPRSSFEPQNALHTALASSRNAPRKDARPVCKAAIKPAPRGAKVQGEKKQADMAWAKSSAAPTGLDDVLCRAKILGCGTADKSGTLFWQFQCEVERVLLVEKLLMNDEVMISGGPDFVNHGLNRHHTRVQWSDEEYNIDFCDGFLPTLKAEKDRQRPAKKVVRNGGHPTTLQPAAAAAGYPAPPATRAPPALPTPPSKTPTFRTIRPHDPATSLSLPRSGVSINGLFQQPTQLQSPAQFQTPIQAQPRNRPSPYNTRGHGEGRPKIDYMTSIIDFDDDDEEVSTPQQGRHQDVIEIDGSPRVSTTRKANKQDAIELYDPAEDDSISQNAPRSYTKTFVERGRLAVAVALCQMICGGTVGSNRIKWEIVTHAFGYKLGHESYRGRWKVQGRTEYGNQYVTKIQAMLHEPFLQAYEKGELPTIDFSNINQTDWPALLDWAVDIVQPEGYRAVRLNRRGPRKSTAKGADTDATPTPNIPPDKQNAGDVQAVALPKQLEDAALDNSFIMEKSWLRALIATPDEFYVEQQATRKLSVIDNYKLDKIVHEMKATRTVAHKHKGRQQPGRNFIFTPYMLSLFNRWLGDSIDHSFLIDVATAWKTVAEHFQVHDKLELKPGGATEEKMLVLNDLLAHGNVKIAPVIPPITDDFNAPPGTLSKWGTGGYSHRPKAIDDSTFQLSVVYTKTTSFTSQHGLRQMPVPKYVPAVLGEAGFRIPFWIDIHGNFIPKIWRMVLRSVLWLLVYCAGVTVDGIEKALGGKLWAWEAELVVEWMERVGCAVKCGNGGWRAGEWWFCALMEEVWG
ncbi:uncharacterized protein LTR77_007539 [Saxophila tyrrhenica]|uniref:TFIIIC transcription initiation factor complex subunits Tfc3 n=1 Tax=Saxophila tyrrhenica TaxID=1690608 RepID=A0AAV9P925_9PEZI|nr:hypothetical protein LTR77_007539 [Saxophila tyrrhenica]